jgi:long-chain acyl-CoA synthetase
VPRLLEKIYEAIYNKGLALEGTKRKLFFWALDLTDGYELDQQLSFVENLKWKLANKLIFSKWRAALGGNVKQIITGAAPCPVKILCVFCAAGIPIREAYGLTETSPTLTANSLEPNGAMIGTVGYAIDGVELYIDKASGEYKEDEGEILVHGPNVMIGYYLKPEINDEVFQTINGKKWFCTGDIGKLIKGADGKEFLKITDRKKELLKTSGGKYVAPAPIENRIKEDFLVEQLMVIGDNQKFVSALILPSEVALKNWCLHKKMEWTILAEMIRNEKVISKYQKVIDSYNPEFGHIEQIKKFKLIATPWLPIHEDGSLAELTPTLKLKRRVIIEKYSKEIAAIYG